MNLSQRAFCFRTALLVVAITMSGCTLPHYKTKKGEGTPLQDLNLTATRPPLEVTLHGVIVHDGPGAWKEQTWWDEYVISITNRGDVPLSIETAQLIDFEGKGSKPGDDPWKLERDSQRWWQTNSARTTGYALALGAGAYGAAGAVFLGGAVATGTLTGGMAAATVVLAAMPVTIVGTVVINDRQKQRVETEFLRRRLGLPASVAANGTANGSLFFRLSPGPQSLVFSYCVGGQPQELAVDLKSLAALHFKRRTYFTSPALDSSSSSR